MKRIVSIFLVILFIVFTPAHLVLAATQETIPGAVTVNAGTNNEKIDISKSGKFELFDENGKLNIHIPPISFHFGGDSVIDPDNFKIFNMDQIISMYKNSISPLTPKVIQDKTVVNTTGYRISGVGKICTYPPQDHGGTPEEQVDSKAKYVTKPSVELKDFDESIRSAAAYWSRYVFIPKGNPADPSTLTYDKTRIPVIVGPPPPCGSDDIGNLQKTNILPLAAGWVGFLGMLLHIFNWLGGNDTISEKSELVSKQLSPYSESIACLHFGCKNGTNTDYIKDVDWKGQKEVDLVNNAGGVSRTFFPTVLDETKGKTNADHPNNFTLQSDGSFAIKTRGTEMKADQNAGNGMLCMLLPKTLQDRIQQDPNDTDPACQYKQQECELPDLTSADGACGICNASGRLGTLAKKILEAAGQQFNVPAAALYTTMLHEGGDWPEYLTGLLDDTAVKSWSVPVWCPNYKPMPKCQESNPATQPPFGFISSYFFKDGGNDSVWNAVQSADPKRNSKDKVSRCNFLDAAFAAAKTLHVGSGMNASMQCGPYTFSDSVRPMSCSAWTDTKFAQSQVAYAGQCPNAATYEKVPYTIQDEVSWYNKYTCQ